MPAYRYACGQAGNRLKPSEARLIAVTMLEVAFPATANYFLGAVMEKVRPR